MIFEDDLIFTFIKVVFVTLCTLGMMSSLTVFKYSVKKVVAIFGVYLLWVALSTVGILYFFGFEGMMRIFLLTVTAPAIFLAYKMDKDSPAQSVFNYATQIAFSLVLLMLGVLINTAIGGNQYTDLLIRAISYGGAIYLEYRFLRKPFRKLASVIQTGWGLLAVIPVVFSLLIVLVGTIPVHYVDNPTNIYYIIGVIIAMLMVNFVVYQSLIHQYQLQMLIRDKDVLQVQISAMNKQSSVVLAAEEKLRILRHDVRHISDIMQSHLQSGSIEQATKVLSTFKATIDDTATKSYCEDYAINAILASYFERAAERGVEVRVSFTAPIGAKIDPVAFSVMLSNALENALNACTQGKKKQVIELKSRVYNGQYLMELSNTYTNEVMFGNDGLPISQQGDGHGIGTRSIHAFAKEHDAGLSFRIEDNRFVLQIMFSLE